LTNPRYRLEIEALPSTAGTPESRLKRWRGMTPTARTLAHLRRLGFTAAVVESWLPHAAVRRDLFGFADVLAVHPRDGIIMLVQATSVDHVAHRLTKAKRRPELLAWLKAGGRFTVHGWYEREGKWRVREVEVTGADLADVCLEAPRHRRRRKGERQRELFA
jgi:hypothetical protein